MATRQMVGQRKPGLVVAIQGGGPSSKGDNNTAPDSGPMDEQDGEDKGGPDVDTCPNCGCEFDEESGKVTKPGAKVVGGPKDGDSYQGRELDGLDSAPPVPGRLGSAHDGAIGTEAMAHLLGSLKGGL